MVIALEQLVEQVQQDTKNLQMELKSTNKATIKDIESKFDESLAVLEGKVGELGLTSATFHELMSDVRERLGNASATTENKSFQLMDRIADAPTAVIRIDKNGEFVASPSISKLPNGRLMVVLERSITWGMAEETFKKLVYTSSDNGETWQFMAHVGPMNWPQVFTCTSGTYIIGTQRHFSKDNNIVISKMMDEQGYNWTSPSKVSRGWSVVAANTGVDISEGKVSKTFEMIPSMSEPVVTTKTTEDITIPITGGVQGVTWQSPPVIEVAVEDATRFVKYCLVKFPGVPQNGRGAFFRVLNYNVSSDDRQVIRLRFERFNLFYINDTITIPAGSTVSAGSSSMVYGGVDWVAMIMSGDESADLTKAESWKFLTPGIGNPAAVYSNEFRELFDVAFRPDGQVRKSIVGFDLELPDAETAWEAGFGSLYWMEGVVTRLQDKHGGNGRLLSLMRVNNDLACDLAAVLEIDDSDPASPPVGQFQRYTFIPGLGVSHPSIVYDPVTDLYWMASNINRDATRSWKQPDNPTGQEPNLHITAFSKCEVDRSTLGLFYSTNMLNWVQAGLIDYHVTLGRHFTYPHMITDGEDLVVVSRATFVAGQRESTLKQYYNNHNSNAVSFHRVRNFRRYALVEWANYQGPYSREHRISRYDLSP